MVEHFFEVVLSNRAKDDYQKIRSEDRLARLLRKVQTGTSTHLERTQSILKQLKEKCMRLTKNLKKISSKTELEISMSEKN